MNGNYSKPVNIGNPQEFTVKDFAETIKQKVGSQSEIKLLPATQDDPRKRKPDISTARKYLNWEPIVPVSEGVEKTIEYFKKELEKEGGTIIPTGPNAAKPKPVASDAGDSTTRLTN